MRLRATLVSVAVGVLSLSGCAAGASTPAATVTVTAQPTPAPTATVAPDAPPARTADSTLEAIDAYALCKAQTMVNHPTAEVGRTLVYAPFDESVVASGPDSRWFVEVPTVDQSREPVTDSFTQCIVGGTIGDPQWTTYGESSESTEPYFEGGAA